MPLLNTSTEKVIKYLRHIIDEGEKTQRERVVEKGLG